MNKPSERIKEIFKGFTVGIDLSDGNPLNAGLEAKAMVYAITKYLDESTAQEDLSHTGETRQKDS